MKAIAKRSWHVARPILISVALIMLVAAFLTACGQEPGQLLTDMQTATPATPEPSAVSSPAAATDTEPADTSDEVAADTQPASGDTPKATTDLVCDGTCQGAIMASIDVIESAGFHGMSEDLAEAVVLSDVGPSIGIIAAQDVIDGSGFHSISEDIEAAERMADVDPGYLATVEKALWVSRAAPYPEELADLLDTFQNDTQALVDALDSGDLEGAKEASHAIHSSQHDLSHEVYEWLSEHRADRPDGEGRISAIGVMAAQDTIDSSGFHGISEDIEAAESMADVDPGYLATVEKALWVSRAAPYPEELADLLDTFQNDTQALVDALDSGDLESAKEASHAIHSSQHDLSHEVYAWLSEQQAGSGEGLPAVIGVMAAQDTIDSSGFHGMGEDIEAAESMADVDPGFLGDVQQALWVSRAAPYPEAVSQQLQAFEADAQALADALDSGDLEAAKEAAHAIHESQHDLSHDTYAWLQEQDGQALFAGLVNPRYLDTVESVLATTQATPWYGDLNDSAQVFAADLQALVDALNAGDLEAAAHAAHAIHSSQHDLSHDTYEWLTSVPHTGTTVGAVIAAQDIIDSSGFHGMSEEIEAAESMADVNPRYLATVNKALAVAQVVVWPDALAANADAFIVDVQTLADALDSGDLEAAKEASHAIHSSQHDLSHEAYAWIGTQEHAATGAGAIVAAQDVIDSTGFHSMSEAIAAAESMADVDPGFLVDVEKALAVTRAVDWPAETVDQSEALIGDLDALAGALDSGDLEGAKEASHAIHSSQHDLSHEVYAWLGDGKVLAAEQTSDNTRSSATTDAEAGHNDDGHTHGDEEEPAEATVADAYADAEVVGLEVTDWEWIPKTVTLKQGAPVVLEVTNTGEMPHGLWIPELGINVSTPPGEVTRVPVTPEKTGEFFMACNNAMCGTAEQHAGMTAEVVVAE